MDEETLEALLAGSDGDMSDAEDEDDAGSDLEDLEGEQIYPQQCYVTHSPQDRKLTSCTFVHHVSGEEERHKVSLQALKDKDPEFYKYLEDNDPALLGFGDDAGPEDDDEDDDEDEVKSKSKKSKKGKDKQKVIIVNKELLAQWQTQMLKVRIEYGHMSFRLIHCFPSC